MEFDRIDIVQGDITKLEVDAIVNAANTSLLGGGGVDGAIHRASGPQLLEACRKLNGCKTGEAKLTSGFDLKAKHVIHTVGPIWQGGDKNEKDLLSNCYRNSLQLAKENEFTTIAFPSISAGVYRYPIEAVIRVALDVTLEYLAANDLPKSVTFVAFSEVDKKKYDDYFLMLLVS